LEIYNGVTRESTNLVNKLCGDGVPDPIVSTGSQLLLRFHSDFSVSYKGFKLEFTKSGMTFRTMPSVTSVSARISILRNGSSTLPSVVSDTRQMLVDDRNKTDIL